MIKNLMWFTITILYGVALSFTPSCNDKKKDTPIEQKAEQGRVFGLYKDSTGKWQPALVMRVIQEGIQYDSIKKTKSIGYDTLYGVDRIKELIVGGKVQLDSLTNKPKLTLIPIQISHDSVMVKNIEGIIIDSLQKKK